MLTLMQKRTAQAIVNIFETGGAIGDYGSITVIPGDAGHLTYGRSQTTLASGNLALLMHSYCDASGQFSAELRPFLTDFDRRDLALDSDEQVKAILRSAGSDPVMRQVQDAFFDRVYWNPANEAAASLGITQALSVTVVYDSKIHGSFDLIRNMTTEQCGAVGGSVGERQWIEAYVDIRRNWLATHPNEVLHKTVYRMDAFWDLISRAAWDLPLPLTVRNAVISVELFSDVYAPPVISSAMDADERVLFLTSPMMEGEDVRRLQQSLKMPVVEIDGKFGQKTDQAVRSFQAAHGLNVDGKVGPATRQKLLQA
jgi:chitosanase